MLTDGQIIPILIEKPAAGGRMIGRVDGQVVLVAGAIPGEQVTARVERLSRGVAFAQTVTVDWPSPDRRPASADPACGGCLYSHIDYRRQLDIKAAVIADAFARIARVGLPGAVSVRASPEEGYRMRARLHVRGGRLGFFREGTHDLCDARITRQLLPATCDVLDRLLAGLGSAGGEAVREIELSENVDASERVVHFGGPAGVDLRPFEPLATIDGLTEGPYVRDTLAINAALSMTLRRHVLAFFQGNRFLLGALASHVVEQVPRGASVVDLYAGAGLFSIAAAVSRGARVVAVEGDRSAAADLLVNAAASGASVTPVHQSVERFVAAWRDPVDVLVVDPPRTGMSREALDGVIGIGAPHVVYVSCDVATLARDARRMADAGYTVTRADGFDLFPNTPHVETVLVFDRA